MKQIVESIRKARFVYICGNGGSASTANHFANDLVKMAGIRAISLCSNEAIVMAYANDEGYSTIFIKQLQVFLTPMDLLITISGSGTSPNIIIAKEYAREIGAPICSFPTMTQLDLDMQGIENEHLRYAHDIAKELAKENAV